MRTLAVVFVALIAALQYPMWLGKGGWLQVREFDRQVVAQRAVNAGLKQRNDALDAEVRDLKTGYEAIEERARSELGMIRQDEVFFQLQEARTVPAAPPRRGAPGAEPPPAPLANGAVVLRITSRSNPRLREVARLLASARDRRKAGKCVLEGEHLIAVHAERRGAPEVLVVADDCLGRPGVAALARTLCRADAGRSRAAVRRARDAAGRRRHPGAGRRAARRRPRRRRASACCSKTSRIPATSARCCARPPRPASAQVLLSRDCAFAWSPKVLRAAQGAHFHVELHEDVDLLDWSAAFVATGGSLVATVAGGGVSLYDAALGGRVALAVGNEGAGLSPALVSMASERVTIPMPGGTESLNAAAAAAVCLFECVRQRR